MANSNVEVLIAAALSAATLDEAAARERADMLVQIAMGLQQRPTDADQLRGVVALYERAIELCGPDDEVMIAGILARMETALAAIPSDAPDRTNRGRAGARGRGSGRSAR